LLHAGVAQLIERFLAKEEATSLSLVTRTKQRVQPSAGLFVWPGVPDSNSWPEINNYHDLSSQPWLAATFESRHPHQMFEL
jgi:hypothetical protein